MSVGRTRYVHRRLEPATWGRGPKPPVVGTLQVVEAVTGLGAQRPVAPPARRGPCFLYKKAGGKNRRGFPPCTPNFQDRSLLARSLFWDRAAAERSLFFIATHVRALIWKLSFGKIAFAGFLGGTAFIQAEVPFCLYRGGSPTHASQPAQLGGGPLRALDYGPQASPDKKSPTLSFCHRPEKGGSREGRNSPLPGTLCVRAFS